jgi:mycothiol system anti-sigma-R factor
VNCHETQELLHAYLDGELDVVSDVALTHHMDECPECTQAYHSQQALRAALRTSALAFSPPEHLQQRIRSAVRRASRTDTRVRVWAWPWLRVGAAFAAGVLLMWGVESLRPGPAPEDLLTQEVIAGHTRALMATHLTDVTSSDQHTVKPWFEGKLPFAPPVQDWAAQGFPLVGGRLDYLGNRPVAALVYQRQQHIINLFLWPATPDVASEETRRTRHGYNLIHWTTADMTYWVVSNLNMSELQEFVRLVQQPALPSRAIQ